MTNRFYQPFDLETLEPDRSRSDHRSAFQVDRDRILFSYAFRRLQSKTQVFQSGQYDFYRTRLTHSIEVARIGRSICDFLKADEDSPLEDDFFIDPDLVEAVGLAHDLGHPPFGHIGERKLHQLMRGHGGFEGNAQTLRILAEIIYERKDTPQGMNPTRAFLDGILKYKTLYSEMTSGGDIDRIEYPENHFIYDEQARLREFVLGIDGKDLSEADNLNNLQSIECQIMDWADDTAYSLHDIADGIKAGFITPSALEGWAVNNENSNVQSTALKELIKTIKDGYIESHFAIKIGAFIRAVSLEERQNALSASTHRHSYILRIDPAVKDECLLYKNLAYEIIFESPQIQQIEFKGGYILDKLFEAFSRNYVDGANRTLKILPQPVDGWINRADGTAKVRLICDHLAGMTDGLAIRAYKRLYDPEFGSIVDLA